MSGQVTISRSTIVLTVALVAALLVVAVLATVVLTDGNSNPTQAVPLSPTSGSQAEPTSATATVTPPAEVSASLAPSVQPSSTPTEVPTVEPTARPSQSQLSNTPTAIPPTSVPTPSPRYASVEMRPAWDNFVAAKAEFDAWGVTTYQQALANPGWVAKLDALNFAQYVLTSDASNLPYDDACRKAVVAQGGIGPRYLQRLEYSLKPNALGAPPTGQAGWNDAVNGYQSSFFSWMASVRATCVW